MSKPLPDVSLSQEEREELCRIIRKSTSPQHKVLRAKIVLLAEQRMPTEAIMKELNISKNTAVKWRKRFCKNRLDGLKDEQRPGKPRIHSAEVRLKIATEACRPPETVTHWSTRELAQHLSNQGIPVSHMTIQRVLSAEKIKPHLSEYWLNSTDPDFEAKQAEIIGLYLNPPENVLVISVDEKTGMQALGRKHPNKPVQKGSPEKMEFEYKRHGTVSLIASLAVHQGEVIGKCYERHTNNEFRDFLEEMDHSYGHHNKEKWGMHLMTPTPTYCILSAASYTTYATKCRQVHTPLKEIHLVVDNLSVHKHRRIKEWLSEHPKYFVHFTPTHASWLNQIELWFSIFARKIIKRGVFDSKDDLVKKTLEFIELYNKNAKPFRWTYTGDPLTI